eukprot:TRINITY_DN52259_c0_g1_i1.p1 TRINITY_DN52259_c0_g1~~TRINITY_DN52259_c0_g1_i1.p1  ORF type:complete len:348 (-),score=35.67 TRINITY_DN52259_c0_g1_i1:7-1050(-)
MRTRRILGPIAEVAEEPLPALRSCCRCRRTGAAVQPEHLLNVLAKAFRRRPGSVVILVLAVWQQMAVSRKHSQLAAAHFASSCCGKGLPAKLTPWQHAPTSHGTSARRCDVRGALPPSRQLRGRFFQTSAGNAERDVDSSPSGFSVQKSSPWRRSGQDAVTTGLPVAFTQYVWYVNSHLQALPEIISADRKAQQWFGTARQTVSSSLSFLYSYHELAWKWLFGDVSSYADKTERILGWCLIVVGLLLLVEGMRQLWMMKRKRISRLKALRSMISKVILMFVAFVGSHLTSSLVASRCVRSAVTELPYYSSGFAYVLLGSLGGSIVACGASSLIGRRAFRGAKTSLAK